MLVLKNRKKQSGSSLVRLQSLYLISFRKNNRGKYAYNQRRRNDIKRINGLVADTVKPVVEQKLEPYKDQQERYPHLEIMEQVDNLDKKEEQRP